jgi:hypothetical protein
MLAGQGFGRWGFIVGNVLMAFGAPVVVTSLVSTIANNRAGLPARNEDIAAIAAGAAFVLAGLMLAVLAGRSRPTSRPLPQRSPQAFGHARIPMRAGDSLGERRGNPVPGPSFGLDDYDSPPRGGLVLDDDIFEAPAAPREQAEVPPQRNPSGAHRNSRHWLGADRFHPPTITGMRSSGIRRRPPAG